MVFAGIGVLFPVSVSGFFPPNNVDGHVPQLVMSNTGQDALIAIFEYIERFLRKFETFIGRPFTTGMTDIIVKSMAELLIVLAIATRETKSGKMSA
jgi:hypothetical protein